MKRHVYLLFASREDIESPLTRLRLLLPHGQFSEIRWTSDMTLDEKDAELERGFVSLRIAALNENFHEGDARWRINKPPWTP